MKTYLMGVVAAAGMMAGAAQGAVIYDNGAPITSLGGELGSRITADDFTLTTAATITDIRFWDITFLYRGSITWQIYANVGTPGAVLFSGNVSTVTRTPTGNFFSGGQEFQDDFSIGAVALTPGTYWLGLHNGLLSDTAPGSPMYWESTNANGTLSAREDIFFTGGFTPIGGQLAFVLSNVAPVPETSHVLLAAVGALALAGFARRRWFAAA